MDFRESLKVDQATIDRCNDAAKNIENQTNNSIADEGGMERGDSGPGNHGREPALKADNNVENTSSIDGEQSSETMSVETVSETGSAEAGVEGESAGEGCSTGLGM